MYCTGCALEVTTENCNNCEFCFEKICEQLAVVGQLFGLSQNVAFSLDDIVSSGEF